MQPRGTQMAAFVVSAAAFTVPEAGYVVSAIVFLLQVRARLAARPGRADACGAELQTREALRGDLRRRPALTAACGAQCPVQYYNYARAGVHALSVAAYTFTRSPVCLAGPLLEVRGAARRARAAGQRLWRRQCAGCRVEADLLSGVYAW